MTEKELIHLTLTQKEALLLSSMITLGTKILSGDLTGATVTKTLLANSILQWPEEMGTLANKIRVLAEVSIENAKDLLSKIKEDKDGEEW